MEKNYTLLQLFSIIDGRLSTSMDDVYDMLNHITGENLYTHHLPTAMKYLQEVNPDWYWKASIELQCIKANIGEDFNELINCIRNDNTIYSVPTLTTSEKEGFAAYMIDNSLLKNIGTNVS